jgi:hypothetical protein
VRAGDPAVTDDRRTTHSAAADVDPHASRPQSIEHHTGVFEHAAVLQVDSLAAIVQLLRRVDHVDPSRHAVRRQPGGI